MAAHDYLVEKYEALGYTLVKAGNIPGFYTDVETGKPGPKVAIFGELDALDICQSSGVRKRHDTLLRTQCTVCCPF